MPLRSTILLMVSMTIDERVDAVTQNLRKICRLMDQIPDVRRNPVQLAVRLEPAKPVVANSPYRNLSPALREALQSRLQRIPAAVAAQKSRAATAGR